MGGFTASRSMEYSSSCRWTVFPSEDRDLCFADQKRDAAFSAASRFVIANREIDEAPSLLMHAGVFHVNVATEPRVEEQVPTGVMVVIVNVDLILIPSPIAAAIDVVGGHNP